MHHLPSVHGAEVIATPGPAYVDAATSLYLSSLGLTGTTQVVTTREQLSRGAPRGGFRLVPGCGHRDDAAVPARERGGAQRPGALRDDSVMSVLPTAVRRSRSGRSGPDRGLQPGIRWLRRLPAVPDQLLVGSQRHFGHCLPAHHLSGADGRSDQRCDSAADRRRLADRLLHDSECGASAAVSAVVLRERG